MNAINEKDKMLTEKVSVELAKYVKKNFQFKLSFIANTRQSKDYLLFTNVLWLESTMKDKAIDPLSKGYDLKKLNNPEEIAIDYYNSHYSHYIDAEKLQG